MCAWRVGVWEWREGVVACGARVCGWACVWCVSCLKFFFEFFVCSFYSKLKTKNYKLLKTFLKLLKTFLVKKKVNMCLKT